MIILILGLFIAKIVRRVVRKLLSNEPVKKVLDKSGVGPGLASAGYSVAELVATIIYVIILLVVFLLAAQALGAETLTTLIQDLIEYLPLVIAGMIVLVFAAWIGTFLADIVRPGAESKGSAWVADAVRYAILAFGVLTALNVVGVGAISTQVFQFTVGAVAVAFAIAFGVGGIDTAKLWWARKLAPRE